MRWRATGRPAGGRGPGRDLNLLDGDRLTAPGYHRVLKLRSTIADLAGEQAIASAHLAEALQCRPKMEMVRSRCWALNYG